MASKWPRRTDFTSDLKFMAQITYTRTLPCFDPFLNFVRKKEEHNLSLLKLPASPRLKTAMFCPSPYIVRVNDTNMILIFQMARERLQLGCQRKGCLIDESTVLM